jgi:hypothetical protein
VSEGKVFALMFGGMILAVIILDAAFIWVLFSYPNSPEWLTSLMRPFLSG